MPNNFRLTIGNDKELIHEHLISYRRRDSAFAGRVRDRLEMAFPKEVFLDVYGIGLAVDYERIIESAISKPRVIVVLIGNDWLFNT